MVPFASARMPPEPRVMPSSGIAVVLFAPYARVRGVVERWRGDGSLPVRAVFLYNGGTVGGEEKPG